MVSQELARMHKEYEKLYGKECGCCCNHRSVKKGYCIAYGEEYCSNGWPGNNIACGLYNRPFAALRPKPSELGLYFEKRKRKEAQVHPESQLTLF